MSKNVKVKSVTGSKVYQFPEAKAKALVASGKFKEVKRGTAINVLPDKIEKKEADDMTSENSKSDKDKDNKSEPESIKGGRVVKLRIKLKKLVENGKSYKLPVLLRRNKDHKSN